MKNLISDAAKQLGLPEVLFSEKRGDVYVAVPEERFSEGMRGLYGEYDLVSLFAAEEPAGRFKLRYVFEKVGHLALLILERTLNGKEATSVANRFSSACWYEREISDGFGIEFTNAFDKRRLFLHEVYPPDFHPLLKSFHNQSVTTRNTILSEEEYRFNKFGGEGVYEIPVGPVHAGIIEPGHFRFSVIGETIFNLEIRMFYKHRGVEKLADGKTPAEVVQIAESVSGDETAANAAAFCMAVEKIAGAHVPIRAWQLRTIFIELERIYSHLGDMAGMITDVAYPVGASPFYMMREEILRQNRVLTGSRFLKGIFGIGGLKRDVPQAAISGLSDYLKAFPSKLEEAYGLVHKSTWVVDRLETTGVIRKELIKPAHITGPAARASGVRADARIDHPYGIYPELALERRVYENGDVMCRFEIKAAEIADSVDIINKLLGDLKAGEIMVPVKLNDGFAPMLLEAPRGQTFCWVAIENGMVSRYKVRTASFCNWRAIEHAVLDNIVPDFPLINKSLNLSYAGTDL